MSGHLCAGEKIGRWTVQEDYQLTPKGERKYRCRCACGTERYVLERALKSNGSLSCGCLRKERAEKNPVSVQVRRDRYKRLYLEMLPELEIV